MWFVYKIYNSIWVWVSPKCQQSKCCDQGSYVLMYTLHTGMWAEEILVRPTRGQTTWKFLRRTETIGCDRGQYYGSSLTDIGNFFVQKVMTLYLLSGGRWTWLRLWSRGIEDSVLRDKKIAKWWDTEFVLLNIKHRTKSLHAVWLILTA